MECAIEAAKGAMTKGQTNAGMVTSCDSPKDACGWILNLLQSSKHGQEGSGSGANLHAELTACYDDTLV